MSSAKLSSSKHKKDRTYVFVTTVDSCVTVEIGKCSKGRELFDAVCQKFEIYEKHWFGLYYFSIDNIGQWLAMEKIINLKNIKLQGGKMATFDFRIRYYPECAKDEIIQDVVKVYFFKAELTRMLTSTRFYVAPEEVVCAVVAFICYLHHENPSMEHEKILKERFDKIFSQSFLKRYNLPRNEWMDEILSSLQIAADQDYIEPIELSLKIMEQSPSYGVSYYHIVNKRGTKLIFGVDCYGLNVYQPENKYKPAISFTWLEVHSVSYDGRNFKIKMIDKASKNFKFLTQSQIDSQQIMNQVIGNHKNFLARRVKQQTTTVEIREAMRMQEIENNKRKKFIQQKQAQYQYKETLDEILKSGTVNENQTKMVQDSFDDNKKALQEQIEEAKILALKAKESKEDMEAQEEARKMAEKIALDEEERQRYILMENERISKEEAQKREIEALTKQLRDLELMHAEDMKNIENLKQKSVETISEVKEIKKVDYQDITQAKTAEFEAKIQQFGKNAMKKGCEVSAEAAQYMEFTQQGTGKFATLKLLRKNNTRDRIDEFEALI